MFESFDYKRHSHEDDRLSRFIKIYDDVLTRAQCEYLIDFYEEFPEKSLGPVWTKEGQVVNKERKYVEQMYVPHNSQADAIISEACGNGLQEYIKNFDFYPPTGATDAGYSLKKYHTGEHYYKLHTDNCTYWTGTRILAFVWYLNDVEEGGETEFPDIGLKVKPRQGRLAVFPTFFLYPHIANLPISGPKYTAGGFISYTVPEEGPEVIQGSEED